MSEVAKTVPSKILKTLPSEEEFEFESQPALSLQSLKRICNLPWIGCTINLTSGLYGKVKQSNAAAKFILNSAEQSMQTAAYLAEPVLVTFEKPLKATDTLICTTIDKIEESNAIAKEARQKITNVIVHIPVQSAINCAKAVSYYGREKVGHLVAQMHQQQQPKNNVKKCDHQTTRKTEPGKRDRATQTNSNVQGKIEFFSGMF